MSSAPLADLPPRKNAYAHLADAVVEVLGIAELLDRCAARAARTEIQMLVDDERRGRAPCYCLRDRVLVVVEFAVPVRVIRRRTRIGDRVELRGVVTARCGRRFVGGREEHDVARDRGCG